MGFSSFASCTGLVIFQPSLINTKDRKSTRLNSSHLVISYAFFCLKKKNDERGRNDAFCLKYRRERRRFSYPCTYRAQAILFGVSTYLRIICWRGQVAFGYLLLSV